jgi:hypothetical protein
VVPLIIVARHAGAGDPGRAGGRDRRLGLVDAVELRLINIRDDAHEVLARAGLSRLGA